MQINLLVTKKRDLTGALPQLPMLELLAFLSSFSPRSKPPGSQVPVAAFPPPSRETWLPVLPAHLRMDAHQLLAAFSCVRHAKYLYLGCRKPRTLLLPSPCTKLPCFLLPG